MAFNLKSRLRSPSDIDKAPSKGLSRSAGRSNLKTGSSVWQRISGQTPGESLAHRDVYNEQQVERSELGKVRSDRIPRIVAVVAGVGAAIVMWILWAVGGVLLGVVSNFSGPGDNELLAEMRIAQELGVPSYYMVSEESIGGTSAMRQCFIEMDPNGVPLGECERTLDTIERPAWHINAVREAIAASGEPVVQEARSDTSISSWLLFGHVGILRLILTAAVGLVVWGSVRVWAMRKLDAYNLLYDTADINQYDDDQHIAVPEEVIRRYGIFPNVGAHSFSAPSSLLGHAMLSSKGTKKVKLVRRYDADIIDSEGEILHLKGEDIYDDNGELVYDEVPMIDEAFGHFLFDKSELPKDRSLRKFFNPRVIPYNPGGENRDKQGDQATIVERINEDWDFPAYEPQRPSGVYFVDEAPVNTMVLAMTRAGKGQTYIEPMIDMWLRERKPNNMVINDPKGELLVKNYVRATRRGYQVVQFNLINSLKTDIYNPLAMASEAAREGNNTACALYVGNIADVFFPVDGGDDPVWPNAANNAFKRTAYGMIDYYLEEERQMRKLALTEGWDPKVLETKLDQAWGQVTLYNCYQFFVQLSSKKLKNPVDRLMEEVEAGKHGDTQNDPEASEALKGLVADAKEQMSLWNGEPEVDMLTLFFNATDALPANSMRNLVGNADKSLRAIGGAEKMLASIYGIAITAMSFFVDPTISTLTSGTLSQNVDLGGMSFPRRLGVRFDQNYVRKFNLIGTQARWESFSDVNFTQSMGPKFMHEDTVSREGWAKGFFEGIYPTEVSYLRLQLFNTGSLTLIKTFYFRFTKDYQTNLKGRAYIKDPVLGEKIVKNGLLIELTKNEKTGAFEPGSTTFPQETLNINQLTLDEINSDDNNLIRKVISERNAVLSVQVNYSEKPKAVFLVTPPHLMSYAKLILILVKQLVDLNFDKSYMTKSSQKPLYKTRYMLDELGNLQSEGNGISGFETMLSIGLGQEQQFTLILQTLQQLRDVYGDSVDKIVQGNTANVVFLKSTDDSMIDTLQKMGGTRHRVYKDSKTISQDASKVALQTDAKVSYQMSAKEVPVISYNDLAYLPPRNSIVFSAGSPPIWNRNETILPMSFALFKNTIIQPGTDYSLQTIPTLSSALEFDVRMNQPNSYQMVEKRMVQASSAAAAEEIYRSVYGYSDFDMTKLEPDLASNEIMDINDVILGRKLHAKVSAAADSENQRKTADALEEIFNEDHQNELDTSELMDDGYQYSQLGSGLSDPTSFSYEQQQAALAAQAEVTARAAVNDVELADETARMGASMTKSSQKIFAEGQVSRTMLAEYGSGQVFGTIDKELSTAYGECWRSFEADKMFSLNGENLVLRTTYEPMISVIEESEALRKAAEAAGKSGTRVHMPQETDFSSEAAAVRYRIHDNFKKILVGLDDWTGLAEGKFDKEVARAMRFTIAN